MDRRDSCAPVNYQIISEPASVLKHPSLSKYGVPVRETAPVPKTTTQKLIAGVGTRLGSSMFLVEKSGTKYKYFATL